LLSFWHSWYVISVQFIIFYLALWVLAYLDALLYFILRLAQIVLLSCLQIAILIALYANWAFAAIKGIGWGWAGAIWLYNIVTYFPLDVIKFLIRYALSGRAWNLVTENRVRAL
jgi:hypothetical protein